MKNSECHSSTFDPEIQVLSVKVVDELLAYWTLESSEDTLEELEEALIVRSFVYPRPRCDISVAKVCYYRWRILGLRLR